MLMATKRPRTTVSFDPREYKEIKEWADLEFRTVPQLISAVMKQSLMDHRKGKNKG